MNNIYLHLKHASILLISILITNNSFGQYTNRYPKLDGFRQQIYIEGFDLPIYTTNPIYYSEGPKGKYIYCKQGKIIVDNGKNTFQIPNEGYIDFQPQWSPDFKKIVFTRDNLATTFIMIYDLESNSLSEVFKSGSMDIDPHYSRYEDKIYFSSSKDGSFDIYSIKLANRRLNKLTNDPKQELSPTEITKNEIAFISKTQFGDDAIKTLNISTNSLKVIKKIKFAGMSKLVGFEPKYLVYNWPNNDNYSLYIISVNNPEFEMPLNDNDKANSLFPVYSHKDSTVIYSEFHSDKTIIKKNKVFSQKSEIINPPSYTNSSTKDYKININNNANYNAKYRVSICDNYGNFFSPYDVANVWNDNNLGVNYCYVNSQFKINLPNDREITIVISNGMDFKLHKFKSDSLNKVINIPFNKIWNKTYKGYKFYSGDNHFHYNVGGHKVIKPQEILMIMEAEDLDYASPLVANKGNRISNHNKYYNYKSDVQVFGQEVRSHFHGHTSILGGKGLFFPQYWGPYYELYTEYDMSNSSVFNFCEQTNQLFTYVHPCFNREPFSDANKQKNTYDFYQNSILNNEIGYELANIWSDELGVEAIYRTLINYGSNVFINAGTDAFPNLFRTPPIGSTRIYTYSKNEEYNYGKFIEDIKKGYSFVTNGPILLFSVEESLPGMTIMPKNKISFSAEILSYESPYKFQLLINDNIVFEKEISTNRTKNFEKVEADIKCPQSGWITARILSLNKPKLYSDSYLYAFTSPIWIGKKNSTILMNKEEAKIRIEEMIKANKTILENNYTNKPINQLNEIDKAIKMLNEK